MSRILVLPGIGDIYWTAVMLRSFIAKHRLGVPEVHVWNFDERPRSLEYVQRIPFVKAGGYWNRSHKLRGFRESYNRDGRTIWPNFHGWDFYLSANGVLRHGKTVEQAFPGYAVDWDLQLRTTPAEERARIDAQIMHGRYVVAFFSDHGMFGNWTSRWGADGCAAAIDRIAETTGATVLLTGAEWDRPFSQSVLERCRSDAVVNLAGDTDLDSFFGLVSGAAGCFGWCGGNTIHAVHQKIPTVIVWSGVQFSDARFHRNACRPDALGHWYEIATVEDDTPQAAADKLASMVNEQRISALAI